MTFVLSLLVIFIAAGGFYFAFAKAAAVRAAAWICCSLAVAAAGKSRRIWLVSADTALYAGSGQPRETVMRSLKSLIIQSPGNGVLFSAILATVVAGSVTIARADDPRPGQNGPSTLPATPEISASNLPSVGLLLVGAVALIATSRANRSSKP